jgi:Tfp pilus assembly protein PilO
MDRKKRKNRMTDIDINNVKNESDEIKNMIVSEYIKHCSDQQLREVISDMAAHVHMLEKQLSRNYEYSN